MTITGTGTKNDPIVLKKLSAEEVPAELRPANFFDLAAHPFEHRALIDTARSVVDILGGDGIEKYATGWLKEKAAAAPAGLRRPAEADRVPHVGAFELIMEEGATFAPLYVVGAAGSEKRTIYLAKGARVLGAVLYVDGGDIFIGEETVLEPTAAVKGPAIIGRRNEIRQGAYFRGNVILGSQKKLGDNAFRGELKNVLMLDEANFPHPSYLGDSICGYNAHWGNEGTAANLGIIQGIRDRAKRVNLSVQIGGKWYDLGRPKMGVVMGDKTQLACETVTDPGTLLGPMCISYPLAYIRSGYYPGGTMFKTRADHYVETQAGRFDPGKI